MGHIADVGRLDGFADRLSRALRRLSMCRLRVSVFAVSAPGIEGRELFARLKTALSDAYEVGQLDADSVGVLYYGPRPGSSDAGIKSMFLQDLAAVLPAHAMTPGRSPEVRTLHVSTAQVADTAELVMALRRAPAEPVPARRRRRAA